MLTSMITIRPFLAIRQGVRASALRKGFSLLSSPQQKLSVARNFAPKQYGRPLALATNISLRPFTFSATLSRPSGTVDEELLAKLEQEIAVEADLGEHDDMPENLNDFLESTKFKLNDKPGMEEVELVRRFGDETIRVVFSIADLNAIDEKLDDPSQYEHEEAPETPEELEKVSRKPSAVDTGSAVGPEEEDQEYEEAAEPAYPVRLNIIIEKVNSKSTSGALQVEAVAQDGMIIVENVHYHQSAELATAQTAEADWERRGHYVGPPFGNLDEDLQVYFERYLDERGINTALALFVPDYIDYKEQKEYISWLKNVKSFVQA